MLQVHSIRENKDAYIKALSKRGIDAENLLEEVLQVDETRRSTQAQLDETLAQSNTYSKEIGNLFKNGEVQKANLLKEKTTQLKETSKELQAQLNEAVVISVDQPEAARTILTQVGWTVQRNGSQKLYVQANGQSDAALINTQLLGAGLSVYQLKLQKPSLEDIFLKVTSD